MPVGNPLQAPAGGLTPDFRYAGMYYDAGSGLYLTQYRAYDPRTARWLSRDPLGEMADRGPFSGSPETPNPALATLSPLAPVDTFTPTLVALSGAAARAPIVPYLVLKNPTANDRSNLYLYVSDNPVNLIDPVGLQGQGSCSSNANGKGPYQIYSPNPPEDTIPGISVCNDCPLVDRNTGQIVPGTTSYDPSTGNTYPPAWWGTDPQTGLPYSSPPPSGQPSQLDPNQQENNLENWRQNQPWYQH